MARARSTLAALVAVGLPVLAYPAFCLAEPFNVTAIKVLNAKPAFDGGSQNNRFFPGDAVQVQTIVRNAGAASPGATMKLRPQVEFVPGPGQTAPPIALVGTTLTAPAPGAGQSATHTLTFAAPAKEGLYKVRVNVNGTPPGGFYLGNSVIDVKSNRAVLLIRGARVLKYGNFPCKHDTGGLAFIPSPLVPVPPTVLGTSGASNCTPADFARVKVENVGNRRARRFSVVVTDTSGCNPPVTVPMPSIAPKKTAWAVKPVQFNRTPGGCNGPYTARVAARAGDTAATIASEILFPKVDLYAMKDITDVATVQSFMLSN